MSRILFLILYFLPFTYFSGIAQADWNLKKDKEGIKIFSRPTEHSKINELMADFSMQATLSELASVMIDVDNHVQWVYATKSSKLLKKVSDSELYFYTEMDSPWPLSNRDLIVHLVIRQDPMSKIMTIEANDVPNYIPQKKPIVRVPISKAVWTVTPVNNKTINIHYQVDVDPGGTVPAWLVNMFATKCPFESFKSLRTQIKNEKYRNDPLSFITNE